MSTDRRPPTPDAVRLLAEGEVEIEGRLPWSSNASFVVTLCLDGVSGRAVYKPGRGERALWDFPGGLYRREIAAYELSSALGWELVPETVMRWDAPLGEGSVQRFVDADFAEHYFTLLEHDDLVDQLRVMAAFDLIANNADRKSGHCLIDADRHVWGIDHGLCFHEDPKLRTVMWDFAGEPIPDPLLADIERVAEDLPEPLAQYLDADEQAALRRRAAAVVRLGRYPDPDPNMRPYPWPLV
ncbi:MAG TPA: SCO1664 family protein [Acidimicrobiales bacterium]|nr:SCO1664 family protein [Acidimicrobiales bacterium]